MLANPRFVPSVQPRSEGLSSPHPRGSEGGEMKDPGNEVAKCEDRKVAGEKGNYH